MPTLQEDEAPIDLEIVHALVACLPETWRDAALVAERAPGEPGSEAHQLAIHSLEGHGHTVVPTAELMLGVRKLDLVFQQHGHPWSRVTYRVTQLDDGDWDFAANFEYPGGS